MASKQADELKTLYKGWVAAMEADPEMSLDELRRRFEHWGDVTAEPGGVDYVEADAGGVPPYGRRRKAARKRVCCCARTAAAMPSPRCTRTARSMPTSPRRSAAER